MQVNFYLQAWFLIRSHDSVSLPNGVDKISDSTSIVAAVGRLLVNDCVRLNDSFIELSLATIKPKSLRDNGLIQKVIGMPPHAMLLVSMQNVINSQHSFLLKMKEVVNEEFDKQEVWRSTLQVQKQLQDILNLVGAKVIANLEGLNQTTLVKKNEDDSTLTNIIGGKWYHWDDKFRRVHHYWSFPNKMTLCTPLQCWFLVDEVKQVCPMRHLTNSDLHNCKNGRMKLTNIKTIMTTLINESKKKRNIICWHTVSWRSPQDV